MFETQLTFIFELAGASNPRVLLFGLVNVMVGADLHFDGIRLILGKLLLLAPIIPAVGIPCSLLLIRLAVPHHLGALLAIGVVLAYLSDELIDDVVVELFLVLL